MYDPDKSVFIIAEAGVNHNGDPDLAMELIDAAARSGADAVKFQHYKTEQIVQWGLRKETYQLESKADTETQFDMLKRFELDRDATVKLVDYARKKGITFLSTPFDRDSVDLLMEFNVPVIKIGSGEISDLPFLGYVASKKKPMIVSTGASTLSETKEAVQCIYKYHKELTLLHCTSCYPAAMQDVNLNSMKTLMDEFDCPIGYSDHTLGITVSIAAVALGAKVIERHITLDKNMKGPDHKASLDGSELKMMVTAIRDLEVAMGNYEKQPVANEHEVISLGRRCIHANAKIMQGEIISAKMLTTTRPGTGISPSMMQDVIGKRAARNLEEDQMINPSDVEGLYV